MSLRWLVLSGSLLLGGCLYHARERTDQMVCDLAARPYDLAPVPKTKSDAGAEKSKPAPEQSKPVPAPLPTDVKTSQVMETGPSIEPRLAKALPEPPTGAEMQQVGFAQEPPQKVEDIKKRFKIPDDIPGRDAPPVPSGPWANAEEKVRDVRRFYPELPPLPEVPKAQPGPDGHPYTLAQLQQIAAQNSPTLRQAASDVEAARGNLIQAGAYPNPTLIVAATPSNDGSTEGLQGITIDQTIKTGGKIGLAVAAAQKDYDNAKLALKRARSDLSTQVRNAYFALLVSEETVRINLALARFTDDVYRLQISIFEGGVAAPYEPAALRAQAYTVRLALKQAIQTYIYNWRQLIAVIGERQLPLSQVAGRIDAVVPKYDYDTILTYALQRHSDVLIARNGLDKARANLKLQQVAPVPDIEVQFGVFKEFALPPQQIVGTAQVSVPIPIWDHNKGGVLAAEAALVRATEEPHRVETTLANSLAAAYTNYQNNLAALEYYRRYILPDQVRTYNEVYRRYGLDPMVNFGTVVSTQQTLVTDVSAYLAILSTLWTSVVGVADFLQTDDLFQTAELKDLPALPDLDHLAPWPCCHTCPPSGCPCAPGVVPVHGESTCHGLPTACDLKPAVPSRAEWCVGHACGTGVSLIWGWGDSHSGGTGVPPVRGLEAPQDAGPTKVLGPTNLLGPSKVLGFPQWMSEPTPSEGPALQHLLQFTPNSDGLFLAWPPPPQSANAGTAPPSP
jgi:cobalt-zinc-cadmium efflux system outer membrane protein